MEHTRTPMHTRMAELNATARAMTGGKYVTMTALNTAMKRGEYVAIEAAELAALKAQLATLLDVLHARQDNSTIPALMQVKMAAALADDGSMEDDEVQP